MTENVSFNIASEASYVYFLSGPMQWYILARFWKPEACGQTVLPDRSLLIGQKLVENAKIEKLKWYIMGILDNVQRATLECLIIVYTRNMFFDKISLVHAVIKHYTIFAEARFFFSLRIFENLVK